MNEAERFLSISKVLLAINGLGPTFVTDYSLKSHVPDYLLEHVIQAICMFDIIKWVGRLPVAVVKPESDVIYDDLTVVRHVPGPIANKIEDDVIPASEMKGSALSEPCNNEDDARRIEYAVQACDDVLNSLKLIMNKND